MLHTETIDTTKGLFRPRSPEEAKKQQRRRFLLIAINRRLPREIAIRTRNLDAARQQSTAITNQIEAAKMAVIRARANFDKVRSHPARVALFTAGKKLEALTKESLKSAQVLVSAETAFNAANSLLKQYQNELSALNTKGR